MTAIPLGTLAIDMVGGAGRVGLIAGTTAAVVKKILDMITAALSKIFALIKRGILKVFSEKDRLAAFDPVAAYAGAVTLIGQFLRDISRARFLGPALLNMAYAVDNLRNVLEPFVQGALKMAINAITEIAILITAVVGQIIDVTNSLIAHFNAIAAATSAFIDFRKVMVLAEIAIRRIFFLGYGLGSVGGGAGTTPIAIIMTDIQKRIKEIRKELQDAADRQIASGANDIFMNDLRALTEGATVYGRKRAYEVGRTPRHDLFGGGPP